MTDEHDDASELVMPFIVCASNGGPYDDDAFVAGWELGRLDAELPMYAALGFASLSRLAHAGTVDQIDLIAMRHGYHLKNIGYEHDGWVDVDLERTEDQ